MAFVKFSRGLLSQYNALTTKDPDTLYLVYETRESTEGSLYLGNKLISTVNNNDNISLSNLTDISLPEELQDGMILYYNASTGGGQWEAGLISDVISDLPSGGKSIAIVPSLDNITNPEDQDLAISGDKMFIYSDADDSWHQLTNSELEDRISVLEDEVGNPSDSSQGIVASGLYKEIEDLKTNVYTKTEITELISDLSHLTYEVVESLNEIDIEDEKSSTTIYLVPKTTSDNNDGYDEYFVVNDNLEKIGSWDIDLSNYVTKDDTNLLLSEDDKKKLDSLGLDENNKATIQAAQVGNLEQFVQDHQLIKSVAVGTFDVTPEGELQLANVPAIDLSGYVQTSLYRAEVGNLSDLQDRASNNSTLVEEINTIKQSLKWTELNS